MYFSCGRAKKQVAQEQWGGFFVNLMPSPLTLAATTANFTCYNYTRILNPVRKKMVKKLCILMFAVAMLTGCGSKFMPRDTALISIPQLSDTLAERADNFSSLMATEPGNAFVLSTATMLFYGEIPDVLAQRVALLGAKEVWVDYDRENFTSGNYQKMLAALLADLSGRGISCGVRITLSETLWQRPNNVFVRTIFNRQRDIFSEIANNIAAFNRANPTAAFTVAVLNMNVTDFHVDNLAIPQGVLFGWSESNFDKNLDNDQLMLWAFDRLAQLRNTLPNVRLGAQIAIEVIDRAEAGDLSVGRVADFNAVSDFMAVSINADASRVINQRLPSVLKKAPENRVLLYLELAPHQWNNRPALHRHSYRQFSIGLNAVLESNRAFPAFRGVTLDNFALLEDIWEK